MTRESFADLLFFTRAAVEADPALANARIDVPLGRVSVQGRPDRPDDPPLAIAGLYRVWDDHAVQSPCPRCGAPRLFLDAAGGGMHRLVAFVHRLCPFCRETNHGHESLWANFRAVRDAVRSAREAGASLPPGLPFSEAVERLRALREADLRDPRRPLEAASLAAARVVPPAVSGAAADAARAASLLDRVADPALVARALSVREGVLADQRRRVAEADAALAPLRGHPGVPSPKERFRRGELSQAEYRGILERKRALLAPVRPEVLGRELDDALVRDAEARLGRSLEPFARALFLAAVESAAADPGGGADTLAVLGAAVAPDAGPGGEPLGATPEERFRSLRDELRRRGRPFADVRTWRERPGGGGLETTALAVRNLSLDEALALAVSFRQTQFVFRTPLASLVVRPRGCAS